MEVKHQIIDCDVNGVVIPVKFYTSSAVEFHLGWKGSSLGKMEGKGFFPKTPYVKIVKSFGGREIRLYTETQIEELIELTELYYPVLYRGRDVLLKEVYRLQMQTYQGKVKELQEKWEKEDYIMKEPPTPPPLKRRSTWKKDTQLSKA
jgi:hypothetical protein